METNEKIETNIEKEPEPINLNLTSTPVFEGLLLTSCLYVSVLRTTDSDLHCTTNTAIPYKEPAKPKSLLPNIHRPPSGKGDRSISLTMNITTDTKVQQAQRLKEERQLFFSKLEEEKAIRAENPLVYEKSLVAAMVQDFQALG